MELANTSSNTQSYEYKRTPRSILNNKIGLPRSIVREFWDLTLREKRVVMMAISKIDYRDESRRVSIRHWDHDELDFNTVIVTPDEYQEFVGCSRREAHRDIQDVAKSITQKAIRYMYPERNLTLVKETYYYDEPASLDIVFNPDFHELLQELTVDKDYISYYLYECRGLTRSAWRLFEILKSYPPNNTTILINDLKIALQNDCEQRTADFLRRILRPAIKNIREKTGLDLTVKYIKRKRRIYKISFSRSYLKLNK